MKQALDICRSARTAQSLVSCTEWACRPPGSVQVLCGTLERRCGLGSQHRDENVQIQYFECGFVCFDTNSPAIGVQESVVCRDLPVRRELKAQTVAPKSFGCARSGAPAALGRKSSACDAVASDKRIRITGTVRISTKLEVQVELNREAGESGQSLASIHPYTTRATPHCPPHPPALRFADLVATVVPDANQRGNFGFTLGDCTLSSKASDSTKGVSSDIAISPSSYSVKASYMRILPPSASLYAYMTRVRSLSMSSITKSS